ncbi:hypothetical protein EUA41_19715 [Bacillus velezensis]|uniref:hypothetical protein n=1 Tax=Bacillus velezensis TaxID=492670 RepID=UPI0011AD0973|nr:hypothetical protein [Bacillus velezensis]TWO94542.1 hypothetical protein EUA41_19715 [Bacillus velezensis]
MRKILLILFLALSGCSSASQSENDNQGTTKNTEKNEVKSEFGFTLNEFINEYNKGLENNHMSAMEEPISKLDGSGEIKQTQSNFVQVLAQEKDNANPDRNYIISGMYNKDGVLSGINLLSQSDENFKASQKGLGAAYILFTTFGFNQEDLNRALKEADPDYSFTNDVCVLTLKMRPSFKAFIIEIRPPK